MINISDKTEEELNTLIQKYASVLQLVRDRQQIPHMALILDHAVTYINENHSDLDGYWKTWLIIVIKSFYGDINAKEDVNKIIDKFLDYQKNQYQSYLDKIISEDTESVSDYDRDSVFVFSYIFNVEK